MVLKRFACLIDKKEFAVNKRYKVIKQKWENTFVTCTTSTTAKDKSVSPIPDNIAASNGRTGSNANGNAIDIEIANVGGMSSTTYSILEKDKKRSFLKYDERDCSANTPDNDSFKNYEIDDTFSSSITKKKRLFNLIPYTIKQHHERIYYKKRDGTDNAFLFSNKIKPLQFSERVDEFLLVHSLDADNNSLIKTRKKNLFDILFNKYSLVYFFKNANDINEMDKYFSDFEKILRDQKENRNEKEKINFDTFLQLKRKKIHLFYCFVSPYKYLWGNYFSTKISQQLRTNYFQKKNFFFMNGRLNINCENCLLVDTQLPSLLLVDENCFVRYHIKGLFTKEASHYLFKVLSDL